MLRECTALDDRGRTPVQAPTLVRQCRDRLATLDEVVGSRCSEADVARCCRSLADRGLLTTAELGADPAVGLGRPAYELAVDPAEIRASVREGGRLRERDGETVTP